MTVTSIAAESLSSRCAICARPACRGDSLCVQCNAAVKRARHVPSLHPDFLPQTLAGNAATGFPAAGSPRTHSARRASRGGLRPIPGGWGIYVTLIAFGAAVSVTGYFATVTQEEQASRERAALAVHAASVAVMGTDVVSRAQAPATPRAEDEPPAGGDVIAQVE